MSEYDREASILIQTMKKKKSFLRNLVGLLRVRIGGISRSVYAYARYHTNKKSDVYSNMSYAGSELQIPEFVGSQRLMRLSALAV